MHLDLAFFLSYAIFTPTATLIKGMEEAQAGLYHVDRENDKLTRALGNPEHMGRTRGKGAGVSWKEGFPECDDSYRSRKRKKDLEGDRIRNLEHEVAGMQKIVEELRQQSSCRR